MFDLDKHILNLLNDEPFFAALSRGLVKKADTSIPTAGVMLNKERARYELHYNPDFMQEMFDRDPKFIKGILMHEFYHIVLFHVCKRLPGGEHTKLWNVAADLAINCNLIDYVHGKDEEGNANVDGGLLPLDKGLFPGIREFKDYPPFLSAEAYMKLLKEDEQFQPEKGKGQPGQSGDEGEDGEGQGSGGLPDTIDEHGGWEATPGDGEGQGQGQAAEQTIAEQQLKELTKKAANEANMRGYGSLSKDMRDSIKKSLQTKVNWRAVLRSFVQASQRADKSSTVKRLNRRYPHVHPGKKVNRQAKVAISIDQSGSVSNEMLAAFYAELAKLSDLAEFTVVPFDTTVNDELVFTWKKGEKRDWERVMCGGTCFNAPTEWVNKKKFDGHIVITDMCAPKPVPSKCQRMWMTDTYGATNPYFRPTGERLIVIED